MLSAPSRGRGLEAGWPHTTSRREGRQPVSGRLLVALLGRPELGVLGNYLSRALSLLDSGTFCLFALRTIKMPPIVQVCVAQKAQSRLLPCRCGQWPRGFTHPFSGPRSSRAFSQASGQALPAAPLSSPLPLSASCPGCACARNQRGGCRQVGDPCSRNAPPARTLGEERGSPRSGKQPLWPVLVEPSR